MALALTDPRGYLAAQANFPTPEQITASPITARAFIRRPGKEGVTIIAAFQLSYRYAYWFVFTAKSTRTPRKNWKLIHREHASVSFPKFATITLEEMITRSGGNEAGAKVTKRYPVGKRNFAASLDRAANPTKYVQERPAGAVYETDYVNRKNKLGRAGRFVAVGR